MSKEEDLVKKNILEIFGQTSIKYNWRPNFLENKRTGKNLEYDIYLGKYRCAIEYQGGVHFKNIERYKNDSDKSRMHDVIKYELSHSHKNKHIALIEIFYTDLVGDFKLNLRNRVESTLKYYYKIGMPEQCMNLCMMLCVIDSGVKYKDENLNLIPNHIMDLMEHLTFFKGAIYRYFGKGGYYTIPNFIEKRGLDGFEIDQKALVESRKYLFKSSKSRIYG